MYNPKKILASGRSARQMELSSKEEIAFTRAQEQHYVIAEPGQRNLEHAYHEYCVSAQTY
jgi:hypothetical protein